VAISWTVLAPTTLAVLGARWLAAVARWPQLSVALQRRVDVLARRMATHQAISQLPRVEDRLLALLLHLAEDWGRMTSEGVVVDLVLTHAELGRLAGARRPTVSLALAQLDREGAVRRREDGSWLLEPSAAATWGVPVPAPALRHPAHPSPVAPAPPVDPAIPPALPERLNRIRDGIAREALRTPQLLEEARRVQTESRDARVRARATRAARDRALRPRRPAP
jgi:hypothetical protein